MAVNELLRRGEADALVREAHLAVHRYPPDFPGFRADVALVDAAGPRHGSATLRPGAPPRIEVAADEEALAWLSRELGSMAAHRWHLPYEGADGRFDKDVADAQGGALGRVVSMSDPMLSSYWIRDGRMARISRTAGDDRFSILIQDHATAPDGRSVATHFAVVHQDDAGGITATDVYADSYEPLWGLLVPAGRRVVTMTPGGSLAREVRLAGHELLDAEGAGR